MTPQKPSGDILPSPRLPNDLPGYLFGCSADKCNDRTVLQQDLCSSTHDEETYSHAQRDGAGRLQPQETMHTSLLVYVGLAAIGKAVGAGPLTIKRWIREEAFPARRCSDGVYRATAQSMMDWFNPPFPGMTDSLTSRQWVIARNMGIGEYAAGLPMDLSAIPEIAQNEPPAFRTQRGTATPAGASKTSGTVGAREGRKTDRHGADEYLAENPTGPNRFPARAAKSARAATTIARSH